jgi:Rps23 Pro-64 3,4-dihydroxylase Tpa1-like proline 4-hydroxylase
LISFKADMNVRTMRAASERNEYVESAQRVIKLESERNQNPDLHVDVSRLRAYQNEIKLTREQRDIEMRMRKKLTEKILMTWKELKDLRARQQFRNTEYKLIIKKLQTFNINSPPR